MERMLAAGSQGILSAAAGMEKYSVNLEPRNNECYSSGGKVFCQSGDRSTTGHSRHSLLQPHSRERNSALAGAVSPVKLLQFCSGSPECNSSVPPGEGFPGLTDLLCSAAAQVKS